MKFFGREQVGLVEYQHHGNAVSLSRCQETVDEGGRGLGIIHRNNQKNLIHIGRQNMTLLGEIGSLADHVVLTVFNLGDESRGLIVRRLGQGYTHPVAHSHRIGAADALQSEIPFYFRINGTTVISEDGVP